MSTKNNVKDVDITNFGYKQELKRGLSTLDLMIYGMLFMGLTAPMLVYGSVAQAGYGMVSLIYFVGAIAMAFTAISYSKMSREFPISGSVFTFVQRGVNPHVGFVFGWLITLDYILIPSLTYILASTWIYNLVPSVPIWVWITGFILFNTIVNVRGITFTRRTNMFLILIQAVALAAFLVASFVFVFVHGNGIGHLSLAPFFQKEHFDLKFIATATSLAALSFLGFDAISTMSEEAKDPQKSVGKATIISLILTGTLFVVQTYMAALIHPNYANLNLDMGFFDIAREAGGDALYYFLIIVNIISTGIAVSLSAQSAVSRVIFTMSRDKLLPASGVLGKINERFKTPVNATLLVAIVSLIVSVSIPLTTIIRLVNFGALTSFMMLNLTVVIYFYFRKGMRGAKSFLNYMVLPAIGFLIVTYVWSGFEHITYIIGGGWALIGIVIGFVKSKGYRETISVEM
jgi:amino acid transporter